MLLDGHKQLWLAHLSTHAKWWLQQWPVNRQRRHLSRRLTKIYLSRVTSWLVRAPPDALKLGLLSLLNLSRCGDGSVTRPGDALALVFLVQRLLLAGLHAKLAHLQHQQHSSTSG